MARKIIAGIEDDVVIVAGVGVAGYLLLRKVLPDFGASPAEKQIIQNQETTPAADNVFSSDSTVYRDWAIDHMDFSTYSTSTQLYSALRDMFFQNNSQPSADMGVFGQIVGWAESLYNDLTGFLIPNNAADAVYIMNQLQFQWQAGAIDEYMIDNYGFGKGLWDLLRRGAGFTVKGIAASDLVNAIERLNNLPEK